MKIVGHRGAGSLAPENTLLSIIKAIDLNVDAVEFDVRVTRDRKLVLCHDADLKHTAGVDKNIRNLTLKQIKKIPTISGEPIPELRDALDLLTNKTIFIEPKDGDVLNELMAITKKYKEVDIRYTTREHSLLKQIKALDPSSKIYPTNDWIWYSVGRQIRQLKADGISINYGLINPLTYWLVKRQNTEIMVFTVDDPSQIEKANKIFNDVWLCTNRPDIALKLKS